MYNIPTVFEFFVLFKYCQDKLNQLYFYFNRERIEEPREVNNSVFFLRFSGKK